MNRRSFLTTATAAAALPALPALPFASRAPASSATAARFWAIYHTALRGDVTPALLARSAGVSTAKATTIRADLIAANVIRPTGIASATVASTATRLAPQSAKPSTLMEKARSALAKLSEPDDETPREPQAVQEPNQ